MQEKEEAVDQVRAMSQLGLDTGRKQRGGEIQSD